MGLGDERFRLAGHARALVLAFCIAFAACKAERPPPLNKHPLPAPVTKSLATAEDPFDPLPRSVEVDARRAAIGKKLYYDAALSSDGAIACATCHPLARYGVDGLPRSPAPKGAETAVNTPSIYNVAFDARLNWQGKFESFEDHLDALVANPRALGSSWPQIVTALSSRGDYVSAFAAAYPDGMTGPNVRDALISFERTLVTPDAPFDEFLRGGATAISSEQLEGYRLFKSYGCATCHQGVNVGGNLVQRLGVMRDYFADRGDVKEADYGRYNVTKDEKDRFVFRVPSLRNVAKTAPYLHDGTAETLEAAVGVMAKYQLGRSLPERDTKLIVSFLGSLTGQLPRGLE